LQVYASGGSS
jgi:hypothetical protein